MKTNLVDRDVYKHPSDSKMSVQDLKAKMSEKLKYVIAEKDSYDPYEAQKKLKMTKKISIPIKYTSMDKAHQYGNKVEDPLKPNALTQKDMEDRVFTALEHKGSLEKKRKGIQLI